MKLGLIFIVISLWVSVASAATYQCNSAVMKSDELLIDSTSVAVYQRSMLQEKILKHGELKILFRQMVLSESDRMLFLETVRVLRDRGMNFDSIGVWMKKKSRQCKL